MRRFQLSQGFLPSFNRHVRPRCGQRLLSTSFQIPDRFKHFTWDHYDTPIESASTPPSTWYTEKEFLNQVEAKVTFPNNWVLVGRTDQVPNEGDYLAGNVAQKHPWVVVRKGSKLLGYYNVCRHHAAQIVDEGTGSIASDSYRFKCPYHGWQYTIDGKLAQATNLKGCLGFKPKENGLIDILVDSIGPWIFIRLNKEGSSGSLLQDQPDMATFFSLLEETHYDKLVHVRRKSYAINCNYKVYLDNYLDGGYHVSVAHPALSSLLDLDAYTRSGSANSNYYLQSCPSNSAVSESTGRVTADGIEARYLFHYPNLCVNRYGKWMDTNIVWPVGHDKCIVDFDWYVSEELAGDQQYLESCIQASEQVQVEDIELCERVQKGLDSPCFMSGGRYAPQLEGGEYMYHRRLYEDFITSLK